MYYIIVETFNLMNHLLTVANCFQSEAFTNYWWIIEDLNGNQCWDDDTRLRELINLFETHMSPEYAYEYIVTNVYDDEFDSVYD